MPLEGDRGFRGGLEALGINKVRGCVEIGGINPRHLSLALDAPKAMTISKPFKDVWQQTFGRNPAVARKLGTLVPAVCEEIERRPRNSVALRRSLEVLLRFLSSPEGRTDANCRAVDSFFCLPEEHGWSGDWDHLPPEFQDILADLGGALHDTITAPEIAQNFESTPEQLLDRTLKISP